MFKPFYRFNRLQQLSIGRLFLALVLLVALLTPASVMALGVLEPQLKSYINERLEVEIPLILSEKEKDDDILVKQVPSKDRNISDWVPELSFRLVTDANNDFTIIAKSRDVVNEPIVHFTISIKTRYNWIYREMSFLLDPRPMKALMTPRAAPADKEVVLKPSEAQPRKQPAPVYREPEVPSPAPAEPVTVTSSTGNYMVQSGDSVSLIERKFRNVRNATAQQAMVSIFNANPHAFINNDINKIKSHVEIVIPDDSEMQKLSATEAKQIFSMLLAGDQPSVEPSAPMPAPEVATEAREAQVTEPMAEPPAKAEPEAPAVDEPIKQPQDYELTLTPDDAGVTEKTITSNEGTIVYETPESMAEKAGMPSEDMRQNIQSAVTDMEEQLTTLREEIKRLQKTLAEKEKQQAATEDSISRTQTELDQQAAAGATDTGPQDSQGPVEMETPSTSEDSSSFDFLRLLVEILTLGAAGGFIGYFIALRRKRATEVVDEAQAGDSSYIRPVFSSGKEKVPPGEKQSTYAPTPPEHTVIGKEGIEVSDANPDEYDESVKRRGSEEQEQAEPPTTEEEVNPEYILQEANLSIAFSDLDNAYHLLMKLINHDPKNPEYRVLMLGVLKDLLKEGEFIFHANHLADITGQSPENTHWRKAVELGHDFLPEHELFLDVDDEITDVNPALEESNKADAGVSEEAGQQDDMYTTGTIVMKSEDALAEHERQMQLKEQSQESKSAEAQQAEDNKPAPLSFDELMDAEADTDTDADIEAMREEETQLSAFRQDEGLVELDRDEDVPAGTDEPKPEPLSFDELLDADAEEPSASKDDGNILEYDGDPFATQSGPGSDDNETSDDATNVGEDPYKQLRDEINSDSLVGGDKKDQDKGNDEDDEDITIVPNPKRD